MIGDGNGNSNRDFGGYKVMLQQDMERAQIKNALKQLIYTALSEYTGKKLPWGTLTGIRPTKIPMTMMEENISDEDIMQYMQETYYISEEKGRLAIDIARREKHYLIRFIMKMGIAYILESHFARRPVCIAHLLPIRLFHGKSVFLTIWVRLRGRLILSPIFTRTKFWIRYT